MRTPDLFMDSSALFSGILSSSGAARVLLLLAEAGRIAISVSEQVIAETERALPREAPRALPYYRELVRSTTRTRITRDPTRQQVGAHRDIIKHEADVRIVAAAMGAGVDYLVTPNRRHFIGDTRVAARSGLRIGSPGDALAWLRALLTCQPG